MTEDSFLKLKSEINEEFSEALEAFVNNHANTTKFEILDKENFRRDVWEALFSHLKNREPETIHEKCLFALRILSRDKAGLDSILTKEKLNIILEYAGLSGKHQLHSFSSVTNEAQKLLCNLIFNSSKIQSLIMETSCLECVIDRISKYDENVQPDIKLFDVRIIFLVTALNVSMRNICNEQHGDIKLIEMLNNILKYPMKGTKIEENDALLACEILKTLFNLFIQTKNSTTEELEAYEKMTLILRKLFLCDNEKHKENLESNIVNLLIVIPANCYVKLIIVPETDNCKNNITLENMDVTFINLLIRYLNDKLDKKINLIENLSPILTCFIKMCRAESLIRKYVRMQVLPPLKDVMKRPEEGSTLRNKLCKLLTTPIIEVRDLAAEFLFILCKEKVGRMIKYTGYGNAAGMFANKGLLGPDRAKVDYSSESEESDTEEYEQYKEQINPVIGCYESPKPNPLENMTEEQKEFEAMKLVNLVDKLQREGVIQPCRIEDGKPKAIEHVLELEKQLSRQQIRNHNSDSD